MDGHTVPHEDNGVFFNSWVFHMGAEVGLWIRQFSGYIDVRFYNVMGGGADFTSEIQAAIDYAAKSIEDVNSRPFGYNNSNTVFVPNGQYSISTLILRTGISLIGASLKNTTIISVNDNNAYLLKSDVGVIRDLHIANFTFIGDAAEFSSSNQIFKGCMLFKAQPGNNDAGGGVWESSIKNILIIQFTGHSINFEGGGASIIIDGQQKDYQYNLPNQFITMEGVQVESVGQLAAKVGLEDFKNQYNALRITGQNGQFSFTNCRFDGGSYLHVELPNTAYDLSGTNVYIGQFLPGNTQVVSPSIINFNTCTFQMGENAFLMDSCNNIKIDGCYFESFERSIIVKGRDRSSKSINIFK